MSPQCSSLRLFLLHPLRPGRRGHRIYVRCERAHGHAGEHVHALVKWRESRESGSIVEK